MVKSKNGIQFNGDFSNDELVIKLSTLLRLFKMGDIRYKAIYRKNTHWYKGDFYKPYKNSFSGVDYVEYKTCKSAPMFYRIKNEDVEDLVLFLRTNLPKMNSLLYSARVFNLLQSINVQLLTSVQFFVIESFFPHIEYQIKKKISEALMIILEENTEFKNLIKVYYKIRSEIAHGDLIKANERRSDVKLKESLDSILKRLWIKLLEENWNPRNSKELLESLS